MNLAVSLGHVELVNRAMIARVPSHLNYAPLILLLPVIEGKQKFGCFSGMLENQHGAWQQVTKPVA
jgi:hypothetical protein